MNRSQLQLSLPIDRTSLAWKIFNAFITNSQISMTETELRSYALTDLKLSEYDCEKLPPTFMQHLPSVLITFLNMWCGWHFKDEFHAGKVNEELYFNRFQKFMINKITGMVREQFSNVMEALEQDIEESTSIAGKDEEFSPYEIVINCPARMMNTIIFTYIGDDIIMKQNRRANCQELTLLQLLNWPHIEVIFKTEDICFIRRQATEFIRYLNFFPHETDKNSGSRIEQAEAYGRQECYSYDFLVNYFTTYLDALDTTIPSSKLCEIKTILIQFLEDVRCINIKKSMATNTVVLFRLSEVPFIRNKKLAKNSGKEEDEARVGYCEIISPKIQLCLMHFKAKQIEAPVLSFEYTDKIKNPAEHFERIPYITYRCTFCQIEHTGTNSKDLILQHMKTEHKMEEALCCTLCKKQFEVCNLTLNRWKHNCKSYQ